MLRFEALLQPALALQPEAFAGPSCPRVSSGCSAMSRLTLLASHAAPKATKQVVIRVKTTKRRLRALIDDGKIKSQFPAVTRHFLICPEAS
jgi:hypothetical protein